MQRCDYTVGDAGEIVAGAVSKMDDIKIHLTICRLVHGNNRNNNMKDPKTPVWVSGQLYESSLKKFVLWQDNVKYTDAQYVDR